MTVGHPGGSTFPTGLGMGATHPACALWSLTRAAGRPPIITLDDPLTMVPGPLGTHPGRVQGAVVGQPDGWAHGNGAHLV